MEHNSRRFRLTGASLFAALRELPDGKFFYFLPLDDFNSKVMRRASSGVVREAASFPRGYQNTVPPGSGGIWRIWSDGTRIAVTDSVHLYTGTEGLLSESGRFPFHIRAVAICGDRVFAAGERDLVSCDMAGGQRRIHLSSGQTGKLLPLWKQRPELKIRTLKTGGEPGVLHLLPADRRSEECFRLEVESGRITRVTSAPEPAGN